jgi:hypothetical protein
MKRRRSEKEQKKLTDDARLLRWWSAWHREQRDTVLAGPHARTLAELFRMFANIECVKPAQLVGFIGAIDWSAIDYQTRLTVLHEVNAAISRYREKCGLQFADDPLPGAPPNAFQIIREIVTTTNAKSQALTQTQAAKLNSRISGEASRGVTGKQ